MMIIKVFKYAKLIPVLKEEQTFLSLRIKVPRIILESGRGCGNGNIRPEVFRKNK